MSQLDVLFFTGLVQVVMHYRHLSVSKSTTNRNTKRQLVTIHIGIPLKSHRLQSEYSFATARKQSNVLKASVCSRDRGGSGRAGGWVSNIC